MVSRSFVPSKHGAGEDFGLDLVAQHNAIQRTEEFPPYQENGNGLKIYVSRCTPQQTVQQLTEYFLTQDAYYQEDASYLHNPPTPRSNAETEGVRTRSGRSTRITDSPLSTTKSRVSKSPAARSAKARKSKVLEKAKTPKLTAPLSVLTKDIDVPVKDMDAWVHRPAAVRQQEVEKRHGYVTRPMNSFMLYRSAYADRTKAWATQNNHQVVSSVAGESWPMEPQEVRDQFNEWAKIERANHAAAHPDYKFSPSKTTKRRRGDFSDDEDDGISLDGDPDGEYRAGGRAGRRKQQPLIQDDPAYLPSNVGFTSHPYYEQQGYEIPQYGYAHAGRVLPSNVSYDGVAYNPQTGTYHQIAPPQHPAYAHGGYAHQDMRVATPVSNQQYAQNLGGYGLPSQLNPGEDLFSTSRTSTPAMQMQYNQYGQQIYPNYQQYPSYHSLTPVQSQQLYEHQQYLQQASQPQTAIDPSLEAALAAEAQSHFADAMGDGGLGGFFEESSSPNQTLAPRWDPSAADLGGH